MVLNNERITAEEIEEFMEREVIKKEERADFHQEVLEWMTMEQILYNFHDVPFEEAEREEAYVYKKNIAFDYLMER